MKKSTFLIAIIGVFVALALANASESNPVYSLHLEYDGNALANKGVKLVEQESALPDKSFGDFTAKVISFSREVLSEEKFFLPLERAYQPPNPGDAQIVEPVSKKTNIILLLAYASDAKSIDIYKDDILRLSVDVSHLGPNANLGGEITGNPSPDYPPMEEKNWWGLYATILLVILAGGGALWWFVLRKKINK
ncbi:hypothetical protein KJ969_04975 [Patescibacteria group bacterium]|nr:hypothetical protein [Patescibacteria group bacterium]MBU1922043.1 hypothetical protein [Patescibacteria group bacterium]